MKKLYFLLLSILVTSMSYAQTSDLLFSKYAEGSSNNKFLEIYNGTGGTVDLTNYSLSSCSNGCDTLNEFDFPDTFTFDPGTTLANGEVFVIAHPSADQTILDASDATFTFLSNGDDVFALTVAGATASSYTIIDIIGDLQADPGSGWEVAGIANGTQNSTLTRKSSVCSPNPNELGSFGTDAATSEWIVTGIDTGWDTLGSYTGCVTDPVVTITAPTDGSSLASGTTSVDVVFSAENAPGTATFNITVLTNGGSPAVTNDVTSPFTITPTADGDSFSVTVDLVDGGVLDTDTVDFSIAYPCDLQVGTITETCDNITPADTDTYSVTIEYTGGGTSTYTIDTGGVGTVGGDDPTSVADGTITITGIAEDTDFTVTFTGDAANSSCDFTRSISSPNCDPQLTLPITETFSYPDGSLLGNSQWASHSGTEGDLMVVSGQALVQHGTPSEDINLPFASVTGDIYYSFDMTIPDVGVPIGDGGTDFEYFAHFKNSASGFAAQLDVVAPTAGGDYSLGIASDQSTADATWATDLSYDTTYRVTVRYNQDTNIAELWVDASSESDPSILGADEADPGETIASFAFRQSDSSENEGILVDNLKIAQTFAETTLSTNSLEASKFSIYPNPTNTGFITITSSNSDEMNVQLFDILGKQIKNETLTNNTLNVSNLKSGIYLVKITQNNASTTKKLVIK